MSASSTPDGRPEQPSGQPPSAEPQTPVAGHPAAGHPAAGHPVAGHPVAATPVAKHPVTLDSAALTQCRRRVHLEHDPAAGRTPQVGADSGVAQRITDAAEHRRSLINYLHSAAPALGWFAVPREADPAERVAATRRALAEGAEVISDALLPADRHGGRRGGCELLVRTSSGYVPVLIVRHRVSTEATGGAAPLVSPITALDPDQARAEATRKPRSHPRDALRLVHVWHLLRAVGVAEPAPRGGVIGLDADEVLWRDLEAPAFAGGASAREEYARRFADRFAVASAAASGDEPLAQPSRVLECRTCPWWSLCGRQLHADDDVSLVVRGNDAHALRGAGVPTVAALAALDPASRAGETSADLADLVALARAWRAGASLVRTGAATEVERAEVEVDVDMESFGELGAYLWGALVSGIDVGIRPGYYAFATWEPLPSIDEGRSFARFWSWLSELRARAAAQGRSFRAYCYNERAENRWLLSSAERFAGVPGVPDIAEVKAFIASAEWVDLFKVISDGFLSVHGKSLKVFARHAGFAWRDADAGGEASMRWYRQAVGLEADRADPAGRRRLLRYNEDDVRAAAALREWLASPAMAEIPLSGSALSGSDPPGSAVVESPSSGAQSPGSR